MAKPLEDVIEGTNANIHDSKNRIEAAAREIYNKAPEVHAEWNLPAAVIIGLPGGLTIALNGGPEQIVQVVNALMPSSRDEDEN